MTTTTVSTIDRNDPNRSPDPTVRARDPRMEVPGVEIVLRNKGTKYLYLQELSHQMTGIDAQGRRVELARLDPNEILEAVQVPLVAPGATRRLVLPLRNAPALTSVEVRIRPQNAR